MRRRPRPCLALARRDAQSGHLYVTLCPGRWMTPHVGSWQRISQSRVIGRLTRVGRGGLQKSPASGCGACWTWRPASSPSRSASPGTGPRPSARLRAEVGYTTVYTQSVNTRPRGHGRAHIRHPDRPADAAPTHSQAPTTTGRSGTSQAQPAGPSAARACPVDLRGWIV